MFCFFRVFLLSKNKMLHTNFSRSLHGFPYCILFLLGCTDSWSKQFRSWCEYVSHASTISPTHAVLFISTARLRTSHSYAHLNYLHSWKGNMCDIIAHVLIYESSVINPVLNISCWKELLHSFAHQTRDTVWVTQFIILKELTWFQSKQLLRSKMCYW